MSKLRTFYPKAAFELSEAAILDPKQARHIVTGVLWNL